MTHLLLTTIAAVVLVGTAFADPIHDAAKSGDIAGVQAELNKGVDVNAKREGGSTPLHTAAEGGHREIVELLIVAGADLHARTVPMLGGGGWTPLHSAARQGHREIVELLIANGSDVNSRDSSGKSSLHDAALEGHKEIVELLIIKGADLNTESGYYGAPLHVAAGLGHEEVVELLIANGANLNVKDGFGRTPLDAAELLYEWDSPDTRVAKRQTADLLRKHGGKTGDELALMPPHLVQYGRFAFSFDTNKGKVYEVQDSFDLLNWEVIKTYTGTGASVRFDEERDHDPPQWFYRVRVVE